MANENLILFSFAIIFSFNIYNFINDYVICIKLRYNGNKFVKAKEKYILNLT